MTIEKLRPRFTFDQDRMDALRAIAPEAFADGRINWESLREALGEHVEEEEREGGGVEHFGLFWPGKRAARRQASAPSAGSLKPAPGQGVNEATTRNIFIEGDNLEVLKLLQKSYAGRVKMIYIDPPYNTGNDFIYSDNFTQPLDEYLRATGQADEMGRVLVTNTKSGGRFHSNWLNMMYPRLRLARNLLRDDGVIFVSIDDNEMYNLRAMMNEIFGEENFVDCVVWQKKVSPSNDAKWFSSDHDYVVIYAVRKEAWRPFRLERNERQLEYYQNPDDDPRGPWNSATYTCNKTRLQRPNLYYEVVNPNTGEEIWPKETAVWAYSREQNRRHIEENRIWWGVDGTAKTPRLKTFLSEARKVVPRSVWLYTEVGHTQEATQDFLSLFPTGGFDSPKPVRLIKRILELSTTSNEEDIIVDFFSGSCTTAHAVLDLNSEDGGNRRFVMVQVPQATAPDSQARQSGFATIADIGKERIRRVIQRLQAERAGQLELGDRETPEDLGFRVFHLARSHFKGWQDFDGDDVAGLQAQFDAFESPLTPGWQTDDLLAEILLLEGFPLDSRITPSPDFAHNRVHIVTSDLVAHRLFVCLDAKIDDATIAALSLSRDDLFLCLDAALSDESKVRLEDGRRVKVI